MVVALGSLPSPVRPRGLAGPAWLLAGCLVEVEEVLNGLVAQSPQPLELRRLSCPSSLYKGMAVEGAVEVQQPRSKDVL